MVALDKMPEGQKCQECGKTSLKEKGDQRVIQIDYFTSAKVEVLYSHRPCFAKLLGLDKTGA